MISGKWTYFIVVIFLFGIFGMLVLPEIWSTEMSENEERRIDSITNNDAKLEKSLPMSLVVKEGIWTHPHVLLQKGNQRLSDAVY